MPGAVVRVEKGYKSMFPEEVKNLVLRGFLNSKVRVLNSIFVLKNLNGNELNEIKEFLSDLDKENSEIYREVAFLLFGIYKIDGKNILKMRKTDEFIGLFEYLCSYPRSWISKLLSEVIKLCELARSKIKELYRFTLTEESFVLWKSYKDMVLCDSKVTIIEGTEKLGLNEFQMLWKWFNSKREEREFFELQKELVKFGASFWNPKAVRIVDNRDRALREQEKEKEGRVASGEIEVLAREEEVSDIVGQLEQVVKGVKDDFDYAIMEYDITMKEKIVKEKLKNRMKYDRNYAQRKEKDLENVMIIGGGEEIEILEKGEKPDYVKFVKELVKEIDIAGRYAHQKEYSDNDLKNVIKNVEIDLEKEEKEAVHA